MTSADRPIGQGAVARDAGHISVVIPAHNAASVIGVQLAALHSQRYEGAWEIVVSDNGSTDDTALIVGEWAARCGRVCLVDASCVRGANYARNVGAAAAQGTYLLFCDADDVVGEGWLAAMANAAKTHRMIGGPYEDHELNSDPYLSWRPRHPQDGFPRGALDFLPYALGGNLGIDTQLFREIGGFNEEFVYGGAEVDLSWRAQLRGAELVFVPDAVVHVRLRSSLRALARQSYARGTGLAHLTRAFSHYPIRRPTLSAAFRTWAWVFARALWFIRSPQTNGRWVGIVFNRLGRVRGSIRHRVLCV